MGMGIEIQFHTADLQAFGIIENPITTKATTFRVKKSILT